MDYAVWPIGDDIVIGYYCDNLYHCAIHSQLIILLKDGHINYFVNNDN